MSQREDTRSAGTKKQREQLRKVEEALKDQPEHPKLLYTAGVLHSTLGNLEQAIHHLEAFFRTEQESAEARNLLGEIYYQTGQAERAVGQYERAVALDAQNPGYLNNLGVAYMQLGELERSAASLKKALSLAPRDALIHSNLGVAYMEMGNEDEANAAFTKALRIDPGDLAANYYLGSRAEKQGAPKVGDQVKVGELIRIYPLSQLHRKNDPYLYASRIEEITERSVTIAAPMRRGVPIPFHRGVKLLVGLPRHDALYGFHTEVIERKGGESPLLRLVKQPRTKRIQRREYVRVGGGLSVTLWVVQRNRSEGLPRKLDQKLIREKNISGSGLLIVSKHALPVETVVLANILLPNGYLEVIGKVVRSQEDEEKEGLFEIAIKFSNLGQKQRDRIIQYVNRQMVELRRKGLLS